MRQALYKCKNRVTTFSAQISTIQYQRLMLRHVQVYNENGLDIVGYVDHCLVAIQPFRGILKNKHVRFTGVVCEYKRRDGSRDYCIKVKNVKKILD